MEGFHASERRKSKFSIGLRLAQIKTEFEQSGGEWKDFKIGDLFEKIKTNKLSYKAKELPNEKNEVYCLSALTAGSVNQGLCGYVPKDNATVLQNVISVSANAAGVAFFQSNPFTILQDSYAIKAKKHNLTPNQYLYILSPLQKVLSNYNWNKKSGWERVKKDVVTLPTLNNELALAYMQQYISELEQQYISELDTYLRVTGLENYELTDKEKLVLNIPKKEQLFRIGDLFNSQTGDTDLQQKHINGKGIVFINSGVENNGVKGRTDMPARIFSANTISIDFWGNAYYRDFEYKMATHNHVFSLSGDCIKNELVGLYLVSEMNYMKKIFSYNNMGTWNKIKELYIALPMIDGEIDYNFMETYIRAVEKKAIQNVVKWKNLEIIKTKQVVNDSK